MKRAAPLQRRTGLRRSRLRPADRGREQRKLEKELDALCRRLVVEIRDKNTCQRCGKNAAQSKIDWSHVVSRAAKSARHVLWNSMALCAGCHRWWHRFPNAGVKWFNEKFPERVVLLESWQHERRRPKIDYQMTRLWLEQQIDHLVWADNQTKGATL